MTESEDEDIEYVSKSQLKRESHALQALGESLVKLNLAQLATFDLPENLLEALKAAQHMKQRGARKRQLQYIGKLMRNIDPAPIQQQLDTLTNQSRQATVQLHKVETWRERLINEGDAALQQFFNEFPQADRQNLRQLIRNAEKEKLGKKPPKAYRELFKVIRSLIN